MNTLVIDRSTDVTSVVVVNDGGAAQSVDLGIWDSSGALPDMLCAPGEIIVGTGPGSFAGIRSALAFAQGCAVGSGCKVTGLTSAAAYARPDSPVAVVGDARRGKFWIALFDGYRLVTDVFQVERGELHSRVPRSVPVLSPDWQRISAVLAEEFGELAAPAPVMDAGALWRAAAANPALLKNEPLPIYLNPAVR